jgi:hypothetical protein
MRTGIAVRAQSAEVDQSLAVSAIAVCWQDMRRSNTRSSCPVECGPAKRDMPADETRTHWFNERPLWTKRTLAGRKAAAGDMFGCP